MAPKLYKVEVIGSGFLAVMAKPTAGKLLEDEFKGIAATGVECVVSLLESAEAFEVGLADEDVLCRRHGLRYVSYPIPDHGLPPSISEFARFTKETWERVREGASTVIHCHAGIGRTGMVAAGILLHSGYAPEEAFARVSQARGIDVPDTAAQYRWLLDGSMHITAGT